MGVRKVKLPSGEIRPIKFPDDWSEDQIVQEIHNQFPDENNNGESFIEPSGIKEKTPEKTGIPGVISDISGMFSNALKSGKQFIGDLPENVERSNKYIEKHPIAAPIHMTGELGAEAADIGKGLINTPYNLTNYLLRKKLHPSQLLEGEENYNPKKEIRSSEDLGKSLANSYFSQFRKNLANQLIGGVAQNLPHIAEDTGIEQSLGLEPNKEKGDELIRAIPNIVALTSGATSAARAGTSLARKGIKKLTSPSKSDLAIRAMEDRISAAAKEYGLSQEDTKALQNALRLQYSKIHGERVGELSPVGQQEQINIKSHELKENEPLTQIPEKEVGEIPPEPDTQAIINQKKDAVKTALKDAKEVLGSLDHPTLKGGAVVKKSIKDLKKSSEDLYDASRKHYVDKEILADNGEEIESAVKDLEKLKNQDELAPGYGSGTPEQKALESLIENLKSEKVKAKDVFDLQRTLEKMADETSKKQYSGVNELEFQKLGKQVEAYESHANKLAKRLEAVGGQEVQSMIKEANKGWRTYKQLTKENPVGKAAYKSGSIPNRALIEVAKEYPGNEFLQALINNNPQLKKYVLSAYTGEKNINALTEPTTFAKKYLRDLPEVEEKVIAFQRAVADVKEGEKEARSVKKKYDALVKSMKDSAKEQKIRQDAVKKSEELKNQIKFHENAIPQLEEKIKIEKEKGENVTKLQEELNEHKRHLKEKNHLLKKWGRVALQATGVSALMHKLGL